MVDMHMSDDQRQHVVHRKAHPVLLEAVEVVGGLALEEPAIHQQCAVVTDLQAVAAAGDALGGAVVENPWGLLHPGDIAARYPMLRV